MKNKKMKLKTNIALLILAILLIFTAGCSKDENDEPPTESHPHAVTYEVVAYNLVDSCHTSFTYEVRGETRTHNLDSSIWVFPFDAYQGQLLYISEYVTNQPDSTNLIVSKYIVLDDSIVANTSDNDPIEYLIP